MPIWCEPGRRGPPRTLVLFCGISRVRVQREGSQGSGEQTWVGLLIKMAATRWHYWGAHCVPGPALCLGEAPGTYSSQAPRVVSPFTAVMAKDLSSRAHLRSQRWKPISKAVPQQPEPVGSFWDPALGYCLCHCVFVGSCLHKPLVQGLWPGSRCSQGRAGNVWRLLVLRG